MNTLVFPERVYMCRRCLKTKGVARGTTSPLPLAGGEMGWYCYTCGDKTPGEAYVREAAVLTERLSAWEDYEDGPPHPADDPSAST